MELPVLNMTTTYFYIFFGYILIGHASSCPCGFPHRAVVNCSNLALSSVPDCVPNDTLILYINDNKFQFVQSNQFKRFVKLKELHLERNIVRRLEIDAFKGLNHLRYLSLASNCLRYSDSYQDNLFEPLKSLRTLRIQGNCNSRTVRNCTYPENALMHATSIEVLYVDGLNGVPLGHGFASLKRLQGLQISQDNASKGYCYLPKISSTYFSALSSTAVSTVILQNCDSIIIEESVFSFLKNLSSLTVIGNHKICTQGLLNISKGLNTTKIKSLKFSEWCQYPPYNQVIDLKLSLLLHNTSLEYLELSRMNIVYMYPTFVDYLPTTLKRLSCKGNRLNDAAFCHSFLALKNLTELDLSAQNYFDNLGSQHGANDLNISSFTPNRNTKNSFVNTFLVFPIDYIRDSLVFIESLDISHNFIQNLSPSGFSGLSRMKYLSLQGNHFGGNIMEYETIFVGLKVLTILDLSKNSIKSLPKNIFRPLVSLKTLSLSGNSIKIVAFLLPRSLLYFDLSRNELEEFSVENLNFFTVLPHSRLNLEGNVLPCHCANTQIITWLHDLNLTPLAKIGNLECEYYDNSKIRVENINDEMLDKLSFNCNFLKTFSIVSVIALVTILIIISIMVYYHKRWKLTYLYNISKKTLNPYHPIQGEAVTLDIDVYISYDMDFPIGPGSSLHTIVMDHIVPVLNSCGLVVKIREDITPGRPVTRGVVDVIRRSKKIIVFISSGYTLDFFNIYEFDTSVIEGVFTRRSVLIPVIVGEIDNMDLTPEVMSIVRVKIQDKDVLYFPKDFLRKKNLFLRQIVEKLKM